MNRTSQAVVVALLAAVVAMGALLVLRSQRHPQIGRKEVLVFAPCGMDRPITSANGIFREAHPEIDLRAEFDNAVVLVRKVRSGARPDVFISPGELEMSQLVEADRIDPKSIRDFATLDMVVIAARKTEGLRSIEDLLRPSVKTIALADPKYNSVGHYGEEALRSLGLWDRLRGKLVRPEHALAALDLVTAGRVDAGITYLSCPLDTAPEKADKSALRVVAKIPRETYPPVRCQVGVLRGSPNRELAQKYADFLTSQQAQRAMSAGGLLPIEGAR